MILNTNTTHYISTHLIENQEPRKKNIYRERAIDIDTIDSDR